jgi:hypothetical protein
MSEDTAELRDPIDYARCSSGEDLRENLLYLLTSQERAIMFLESSGLPEDLCVAMHEDIKPLGQQLLIVSNSSLDYIKTFLLDGTKLRESIQLATGLEKLDLLDDFDLHAGMISRIEKELEGN